MEKDKKKKKRRSPWHSDSYDARMYKIMAEHLGEEIFVTDGEGRIIFVNPKSIEFLGMPVYDIIGKTSAELVEMGCFDKSVSQEVLRTGEKADILQKLSDGRTVLATGIPVYDNNHERILMTISTSKDVSEVNRLLHTVEEQEAEIAAAVREVIDGFGPQGLILGADCTLPTEIPTERIAAAVHAAVIK